MRIEPPEAPAALLAALEKPEVEHNGEAAQLTPDQLKEYLSFLDAVDFAGTGGGDWFELLAACHHATGGDPEGFAVFEEWCDGDPSYAGDASRKVRWKSCHADRNNGFTAATLFHFVNDAIDALPDEERLKAESRLAAIESEGLFGPVEVDEEEQGPIRIEIKYDESRVVGAAASVLDRIPNLYQRSGRLVRVAKVTEPPHWQRNAQATSIIQEVQKPVFRTLLTAHCHFFEQVMRESELKPAKRRIPGWLVDTLFMTGEWKNVPAIRGIVHSPCLLEDGNVLQTPGFNRDYGLLYEPNQDFPSIPELPSHEDAVEAVATLKEVVCDFPFVGPEHRSVWMAAVLTMLARHSYDGATPMFFVDGNSSGVGKTLLVETVGQLCLGESVPAMAYPPSNEEMEKRLTTIIMNASPAHLIDNVPNNKRFGFPSLDAAITSGTWESRILGRSESTGKLPITTLLFATGNNVELGGDSDSSRRLAYCRLDWEGENPSSRSDFRHGADGSLKEWITANRPRLVTAALTLLRAYHVAGQPTVDMQPWGSFREWSNAVRAPLIWAGEPDPKLTHELLEEQADAGLDELETVLNGWFEVAGTERLSVSDMLGRLFDVEADQNYPAMQTALDEVLDPDCRRNQRSIGKRMREFAGKTRNGMRLSQHRIGTGRGWRIDLSKELQFLR